MENLVQAKGWTTWPRTITGKLELKSTTIGKQAKCLSENILNPVSRL